MSHPKPLAVALTALLLGSQFLGASRPAVAHDGLVAQASQSYQKPLPPQPTVEQTYQKPLPPISQPADVFGLEDGTPVQLKTSKTLSSKSADENDPVEFEVTEAISIGNVVVIPKGAIAKGIVTEAKRGKMLGRKGKLSIAVQEVTLANGERVALRADKSSGGGLSAGVIAATVVLSPLFLLMGGSNVTYKAGTEVTAYVDGNYALDPTKFKATPQYKIPY